MRASLRKAANLPLGIIGVEIVRKREYSLSSMPTWMERLGHAKKLGYSPDVILDGGAFRGLWSVAASRLFPGSRIVMVEPNPFMQDTIRRNTAGIRPPVVVLDVALGQVPGESTLNIWGDVNSAADASLLEHIQGKPGVTVKVRVDTLDRVCEGQGVMPNLVKLDLQGGELAALNGAARTLAEAELFIIEFGCLDAYEGRATPRQIMDVMYDSDYSLYDIVDCHYRPYDGAMTGGDFFFVRNSSGLRSCKGWE